MRKVMWLSTGKKEGEVERNMTVLREQGCAVEEGSTC